MFPTIGHFLGYLFGTEVNFPLPSYGFLLATAFFSAYLVMRLEFKRKYLQSEIGCTYDTLIIGRPASKAELASHAFFGFLVGFKIIGILLNYDLFSQDVQYYIISLEGNVAGGVVGGALFAWYIYYRKNKSKLPYPKEEKVEVEPWQHAAAILLIAAIAGIVGAKIFHQLENFNEFLNDPLGSLFSGGGLTFYGGLIFGVIAVLVYIRKTRIHYTQMMDVAAPAIMLAYGIGRIGCMVSGDGCWGVVNPDPKPEWLAFLPDWMWAYNYPHNVINSGVPLEGCVGRYCHVLSEPVWPTPFYESTVSILFFAILWSIRKMIKAPGTLFSIFLIMNGVERFFVEKIRVNNKLKFASVTFTQAELISVLLVLFGIAGVIYFRKRHKRLKAKILSEEKILEEE